MILALCCMFSGLEAFVVQYTNTVDCHEVYELFSSEKGVEEQMGAKYDMCETIYEPRSLVYNSVSTWNFGSGIARRDCLIRPVHRPIVVSHSHSKHDDLYKLGAVFICNMSSSTNI
jgi:hypothetical protein